MSALQTRIRALEKRLEETTAQLVALLEASWTPAASSLCRRCNSSVIGDVAPCWTWDQQQQKAPTGTYPQVELRGDTQLAPLSYDIRPLHGTTSADPVLSHAIYAQACPDVVDALASVMGSLQINQVGEPCYVGPTSNLHLPRAMSLSTRPRMDRALAQSLNFLASPVAPQYLLDHYWKRVHRVLPMFHLIDAQGPTLMDLSTSPFLLCQILAVSSCSIQPVDYHFPSRQASIDFYESHLNVSVSAEIDRVCLSNVQAFTLRSYLYVFRGELGSADIFLGK